MYKGKLLGGNIKCCNIREIALTKKNGKVFKNLRVEKIKYDESSANDIVEINAVEDYTYFEHIMDILEVFFGINGEDIEFWYDGEHIYEEFEPATPNEFFLTLEGDFNWLCQRNKVDCLKHEKWSETIKKYFNFDIFCVKDDEIVPVYSYGGDFPSFIRMLDFYKGDIDVDTLKSFNENQVCAGVYELIDSHRRFYRGLTLKELDEFRYASNNDEINKNTFVINKNYYRRIPSDAKIIRKMENFDYELDYDGLYFFNNYNDYDEDEDDYDEDDFDMDDYDSDYAAYEAYKEHFSLDDDECDFCQLPTIEIVGL